MERYLTVRLGDIASDLMIRVRERKAEATVVRTILSGHEHWPGMWEPFNGQHSRLQLVRALIEDLEPDVFVETGTFIASSTRFFSGQGVPVYTAEIRRSFALLARLRLGWRSDVKVTIGDSREMLRRLASTGLFARPFVYLDAYTWWEDLPVESELAIVCGAWDNAIVVVDDFRAESDALLVRHIRRQGSVA